MANFRMAALAMAVAAAMTGSQALAADGALAPGKPAGVQEAQHHGHLLLIGGVTAVVVAGIVIAAANSGGSSCSATNCPNQTSSTSTTS